MLSRGRKSRRKHWRERGDESASRPTAGSPSRVRRRVRLVRAAAAWTRRGFLTQVQAVLDRISATPELYAQVFQDVRRAVVQRFPYAVFYKIEPQQVVVLAVFHSRRDPKIWQERA